MAYRHSHIVVATANGRSRIMGPFTAEDKALDFVDRIKARRDMDRVAFRVAFIRPPKVLESTAAIREFLP